MEGLDLEFWDSLVEKLLWKWNVAFRCQYRLPIKGRDAWVTIYQGGKLGRSLSFVIEGWHMEVGFLMKQNIWGGTLDPIGRSLCKSPSISNKGSFDL